MFPFKVRQSTLQRELPGATCEITLLRDMEGLYRIDSSVRRVGGNSVTKTVVRDLDCLSACAQQFDARVRESTKTGYVVRLSEWHECPSNDLLRFEPTDRGEAKVLLAPQCSEPGVGEVITLLRRRSVPMIYAETGSRMAACLLTLAIRGHGKLLQGTTPLSSLKLVTLARASVGDTRTLLIALGVLEEAAAFNFGDAIGSASRRALVL